MCIFLSLFMPFSLSLYSILQGHLHRPALLTHIALTESVSLKGYKTPLVPSVGLAVRDYKFDSDNPGQFHRLQSDH